MSIRGLRMESLLSPVAISVIAFALGYQVRNYFTPTAPSLRSSPSNPTPNSVPTPKDSSVIDLTDKSPSPGGNKGKGKSKKLPLPTSPSSASDSESEAEVDTDSEAEDLALALSSNPQSLKPTAFDEVKLVLVVNDSLHMTKGKIAAQAGHATLGCALMMKEVNPRMYKHWERHGQPKIALKCKDTEELEVLAAQARSLNLCARTIQDAGRTQVAPGSKTILGIGPGPARLINQVTGKLKLL